MAKVSPFSLPFEEQIKFFEDKVPLPTNGADEIREGMHSRAFVITGVAKESFLAGMKSAVLKALQKGTTLREFAKDYRRTAAATGFSFDPKTLAHRLRTIYETNIRQSYNAGRELQMRDEDLRNERPYGLYRHGGSEHPRKDHLALDGTVVRLDDPFWETWTPQNGWGCKCKKFMISAADAKRMGLRILDTAPVPALPPDPGFAYNPGTAAWGRSRADKLFKEAQTTTWEPLTSGDWQSEKLPENLTPRAVEPKVAPPAKTVTELEQHIRAVIGGKSKVFSVADGRFQVNVDAEYMAKHLFEKDPGRGKFLDYLPELIANPSEVWETFSKSSKTGRVVLRRTLVTSVSLSGSRPLVFVADAQEGGFAGYTFYTSEDGKVNKSRVGKLIHRREP